MKSKLIFEAENPQELSTLRAIMDAAQSVLSGDSISPCTEVFAGVDGVNHPTTPSLAETQAPEVSDNGEETTPTVDSSGLSLNKKYHTGSILKGDGTWRLNKYAKDNDVEYQTWKAEQLNGSSTEAVSESETPTMPGMPQQETPAMPGMQTHSRTLLSIITDRLNEIVANNIGAADAVIAHYPNIDFKQPAANVVNAILSLYRVNGFADLPNHPEDHLKSVQSGIDMTWPKS